MWKVGYVSVKLVRIAAWPLLALMILYLLTGYVLCGQHGLGRWMSVETALAIHRFFGAPLVALLLAHVIPGVYLALRRRGWIRKRRRA